MDEIQLTSFFTNQRKKYFNDRSSMSLYFDSNLVFKNAYKGTFAMDEFSHIDMTKFDKCLIIFNLITRDMQTMGHWLALYSKRLKR